MCWPRRPLSRRASSTRAPPATSWTPSLCWQSSPQQVQQTADRVWSPTYFTVKVLWLESCVLSRCRAPSPGGALCSLTISPQVWTAPILILYYYFTDRLRLCTLVSRPGGASFRILTCYLFLSQILFYRPNVTNSSKKLSLNTLCTMQASCRRTEGQAKIKPVQEKNEK